MIPDITILFNYLYEEKRGMGECENVKM